MDSETDLITNIKNMNKTELVEYLVENLGDEVDPQELKDGLTEEKVEEYKTLLIAALTQDDCLIEETDIPEEGLEVKEITDNITATEESIDLQSESAAPDTTDSTDGSTLSSPSICCLSPLDESVENKKIVIIRTPLEDDELNLYPDNFQIITLDDDNDSVVELDDCKETKKVEDPLFSSSTSRQPTRRSSSSERTKRRRRSSSSKRKRRRRSSSSKRKRRRRSSSSTRKRRRRSSSSTRKRRRRSSSSRSIRKDSIDSIQRRKSRSVSRSKRSRFSSPLSSSSSSSRHWKNRSKGSSRKKSESNNDPSASSKQKVSSQVVPIENIGTFCQDSQETLIFFEKLTLLENEKWNSELRVRWKRMENDIEIMKNIFFEIRSDLLVKLRESPFYSSEKKIFLRIRREKLIKDEGKSIPYADSYDYSKEWEIKWEMLAQNVLQKKYDEKLCEIRKKRKMDLETLKRLNLNSTESQKLVRNSLEMNLPHLPHLTLSNDYESRVHHPEIIQWNI